MFSLENNIKLGNNEKVLYVMRTGWKYYIFKLLIFFLLILIPSFFYFFLITKGIHGILILITVPFLAILYGIRILVFYYFNIYIFTDERIIGIEQKSIFERLIIDIKIRHIKKVDFFKKNSLYLELLNGKNLILEKIDEREYIYEILRELIAKSHSKEEKAGFKRREI
ncbi:MAG: hypothetical protein V1891_04335 [bacterium]